MTTAGLYFDMRNPPDWRRDWGAHYQRILGLCEKHDAQGLGAIWLSEHHFFEDGYLSQPLTLAAAIAARTKRARIGTAVLLAPLRSAVQIAEEAAIVDLVSNGRCDLGLGAGYRIPEFEAFGADVKTRWRVTEERAREIRALWDAGRITPPPAQKRPRIWIGAGGPKGAARAGRLGESLLNLNPEFIAAYREAYLAAGHDPAGIRCAGVVHGILSRDPEKIWPVVAKHLDYQWSSYRRYGAEGTGQEARHIPPQEFRRFGPNGEMPGFLLATPEEAGRLLRERLAGQPVENIFFWGDIAGLPDEIVEEHCELVTNALAAEIAGIDRMPVNPDAPPWQFRAISRD